MRKFIRVDRLVRTRPQLLLLFTLALVGLLWVKITAVQAVAGINEQINYQGRLLTAAGAVVPDGTYNMEFKVYQDGDGILGGSDEILKWTETRIGSNKVLVKNGYFSVYLGSVTPFNNSVDWNQDAVWLSINIGGTDTPNWDSEMSPFTRLSSAPYALNSGRLGGLDSGSFVQLGQGLQADASSTNASIAINKTGSTANIFELQRAGSPVLTVANEGASLFKNSTDSTTAFQIQDAVGTGNLFNADTTNLRIGIRTATPSYTLDVAGDVSASFYRISGKIAVSMPGTQNIFVGEGAGNQTLTSNSNAALGYQALNAVTTGSWNTAVGQNALKVNTTGSGNTVIGQAAMIANTTGGSNVAVGANALGASNASNNVAVGSAALRTKTSGDYNVAIGSAALNDNLTGAQNTAIGQAAGKSNTGSGNVFLGFQAGYFETGSNKLYVANSNTTTPLIYGDFSSAALTVNGSALFKNGTDSTTAFQIQNAAGTQIFNIDTTNSNLISNPSFESNTTGWSQKGLGTVTLTRNTTEKYIGNASMQITKDATTFSGAKFQYNLASSTQYTFSVYAKASGSSFSTLDLGYSNDGSSNSGCAASQTVSTGGWTRYTCTFTTGTTTAGSSYVYVDTSDAVARTFYIDAAQLVAGSTGIAYKEGAIALNGVVNSSLTLQNATDSTTAFQIQNAAGTSNLFVADTVNNKLSTSGDLSLDATGSSTSAPRSITFLSSGGGKVWRVGDDLGNGLQGGSGKVTQLYSYNGIVLSGNRVTGTPPSFVNGLPSSDYSVSVLAGSTGNGLMVTGDTLIKAKTGDSATAFQIQNAAGTSNLFVADTTNGKIGIGTLPGNGLLTIGGNTTSPSGGLYFGTDVVVYRDGADALATDSRLRINKNGGKTTLVLSSTGTNSGLTIGDDTTLYRSGPSALKTDGSLEVAGSFLATSTALFKNSADGTMAFQIQNAAGSTVLSVDTVNGQLNTNALAVGQSIYSTGTIAQTGTTITGTGTSWTAAYTGATIYYPDGTTATVTFVNATTLTSSVSKTVAAGSAYTLRYGGLISGAGFTITSQSMTVGDQLLVNNAATINKSLTVTGTVASTTELVVTGTSGQSVDIAQITKSGTVNPLFAIGSAGAAMFRNASDSTNAFVIQNAAGTSNLFVADTSNSRIGIKTATPLYALDVVSSSSQIHFNSASGEGGGYLYGGGNTALLSAGASFNGTNWIAQNSEASLVGILTGGFAVYANAGLTPGTSYVPTTRVIVNAAGALFNNSGTAAFKIQNSAGNSNLFVANTTDNYVGIGTGSPANGLLTIGTNTTASTGGLYFGTDTNLYRSGANALKTDDNLTVGLNLPVNGNITSNLGLSSQVYMGNTLGKAGLAFGGGAEALIYSPAAGQLIVKPNGAVNDSTAAFQIQNSAGTSNLFVADTTNSRIGVGTNTPSYMLDVNGAARISGAVSGYNAAAATLYVGKDGTTDRSINAAGSINASGADYAEWIPWSGTKPLVGSVVNYAGSSYIVSSKATAAFVGNDVYDEAQSILVTFAGQVPVRVTGTVNTGDILVSNGDGTARAVAADGASIRELLSKLAVAQESNSAVGVKLIKASVGTTSDSIASTFQTATLDVSLVNNNGLSLDEDGKTLNLDTDITTIAHDADLIIDLAQLDTSTLYIKNSKVGEEALANLDVDGAINAAAGYKIGNVAGASITCLESQSLHNQVVLGGLIVGGTCAAADNVSFDTTRVTIDSGGNATFAGTITASQIKTDQLGSRNETADNLKIQSLDIVMNLNVNGNVAIGGGLTVGGPTEFKAQTAFQKLVLFFDKVIFKNDVSFEGHATFNRDAAGIALIKAGSSKVEIKFQTPYAQSPIVNANFDLEDTVLADGSLDTIEAKQARLVEGDYNMAVGRVSPSGFVIILNKPAGEDIRLHWQAVSVAGAVTALSQP